MNEALRPVELEQDLLAALVQHVHARFTVKLDIVAQRFDGGFDIGLARRRHFSPSRA